MKWLKQFQSLHTKLVIVYVLLIIIGMQIIGLYFTNSLEKEMTETFKTNISQNAKQIELGIEKYMQMVMILVIHKKIFKIYSMNMPIVMK